MWNAVDYFETLNGKLKLTKGLYTFCRVSGLNYLEGILSAPKSATAYLAVDDSDDGVTIKKGGSFYNRRSIVVYILKKYDFKDQIDREEKLNECRVIHKKLLTKLIKDSNEVDDLMYLDQNRTPFHEVAGMFVSGTTGIYFITTLDEPVELIYDDNDWD